MNETSQNDQPTADNANLEDIAKTTHREAEDRIREAEDRIFQTLLDSKESKLELVEIVAPKLAGMVDKEALQDLKQNFVDRNLGITKEDYVFEGKALFSNDVTFEIVVLTAHQSSSNRHMALRILRAMTGLWGADWADSKSKSKSKSKGKKGTFEQRLILPILIYTGKSKWRLKSMRDVLSESLETLNLSEDLKQLFLKVTPDFEILMLDLPRFDLENLARNGTLLSCVLSAMGAKHSMEKTGKISKIVAERISESKIGESDQKEIVQSFLKVFLHRDQSHFGFEFVLNEFKKVLGEQNSMLNKNSYAYEIHQESLAEGMKQGLEQGVAEGMKQGVAQGLETLRESILKLILKRFPKTSGSEAQSRLAKLTDLKKLKAINDRVLDWQDFDDVWTIPETGDA